MRGISVAKLTLYKYVRTERGWRYCKAVFHPNGKIKPNVVVVGGVEEKHTEGRYFLNSNDRWIDVGTDAIDAQRKRLLLLNQIEYARLSGRSLAAASAGQPSVVEFSGRKVIKDEVEAYLANLELAKRPHRTVQSKRRFLSTFLSIVPKKFADEFRRDDVLTFRNKLMQEYEPKSVDTMMMCVVTFFNRWLKIKLGVEKSDWPLHDVNDPEPYLDDEIVALEKVSTGIPNLLIRLFRSVGCREMEIAHLNFTDINLRTKEIMIRQKPCFHCKDCVSEGNVWKPKTKAGTRNIPISDSLLSELLALPKGQPPKGVDAGLLFPNKDGNVNGHLLNKIQRATKQSGVPKVKLHRFRDTFITNKLRDGVDVRTVQRWAGHEDVNVTMGYAAWLDGQSKAARDAANREDTRYRKTGTQGD
jgi:integrase/recombinase XerD